MPWSSQAQIAQLVIIEGANDGLFVYNGTPAAGSLIASITSANGTDQFGNATIGGVTTYFEQSPTHWFAQSLTGDETLYQFASSAAGPYSLVFSSSPGFLTFAGQQGPFLGLGGNAQSLLFGNTTFMLAPSGDTSGATDLANLNSIVSLGNTAIILMPGTFYLNGQFTAASIDLSGFDMQTIVRPNTTGTPYTGALLAAGNNGTIRNLQIANSGGDAITVAGGISNVWLTDLFFTTNTGNCINWTVTGAAHGRIRGIRGGKVGSSNGGGIRIDGGTGTVKVAIINIYDVDIQQCNASEVLFLSAVSDVLVNQVNGAIASGTAANAITVQGQCTTCYIDNVDVGGSSSGTGVAVFQAAGGNFPSDCRIEGKLQAGAVGLVVNDGTARCMFDVVCSNNQGDGAQFNGNGVVNKLRFAGNINNQAAGVAYDINVTSTVHLLVEAPQATGGAVTANCNITLAGNHVSVNNVPAGFTFAGNAQAGW